MQEPTDDTQLSRFKNHIEFFNAIKMTAEVDRISAGNTTPALRSRAFQLTLNEPEKFDELIKEFEKLKSCDYAIACKEIAPTTGHEHIHLYVHFTQTYQLSRKILSYHAHVEKCRGSPRQNIAYIRKDGDIIYERGEEPHQGSIISVKELMEVKNVEDLEDYHAANTYLKIKQLPKKQKVKEWKKDVKVIYIEGPSGIGKSERAQEILEENNIEEFEEVKHTGQFWNGCIDGQGAAVYDDFRDSHMSASEFINFIDYRVHNLNVKGGSVRNNYNLIIITSIQELEELYRNVPQEAREQWIRRIERIHLPDATKEMLEV